MLQCKDLRSWQMFWNVSRLRQTMQISLVRNMDSISCTLLAFRARWPGKYVHESVIFSRLQTARFIAWQMIGLSCTERKNYVKKMTSQVLYIYFICHRRQTIIRKRPMHSLRLNNETMLTFGLCLESWNHT